MGAAVSENECLSITQLRMRSMISEKEIRYAAGWLAWSRIANSRKTPMRRCKMCFWQMMNDIGFHHEEGPCVLCFFSFPDGCGGENLLY